jgi:C4-dicarboxylate-specific signal transduction histidine kinase
LDVEYRVLQPTGDVTWFAARGRADQDAQRMTGVALDITARKAGELQAQKDRAALTHMTRVSLLGQLTASITHELFQPLTAILSNAEAARIMVGRERPDFQELKIICDDIIKESNRAVEVIRRLGPLYKRGELNLVPLDLNELVRETLDLVRTEMLIRHVVPITVLAPSLPLIDGDRVQLQQVLLNLVLNASDARSEFREADRTLTVRTEIEGANVRLSVRDRGTGIAPENIEKVFDVFWTTKSTGMGMGLAICRSIVTAHDGTLTVTNNSNGGATFDVTWPQRHSA